MFVPFIVLTEVIFECLHKPWLFEYLDEPRPQFCHMFASLASVGAEQSRHSPCSNLHIQRRNSSLPRGNMWGTLCSSTSSLTGTTPGLTTLTNTQAHTSKIPFLIAHCLHITHLNSSNKLWPGAVAASAASTTTTIAVTTVDIVTETIAIASPTAHYRQCDECPGMLSSLIFLLTVGCCPGVLCECLFRISA